MTTIRRRVLRPNAVQSMADPRQTARLQRQRIQLQKNQAALKRWTRRLTRASNSVTSLFQKIARLETALENAD